MVLKELVKKRRELKERIPRFARVNAARLKKLRDKGWRRPRGRHNKIRKGIKGEGKRVKIGYGVGREMKHLHPSGYKEVLVYNLEEVKNINKEEEAIRIASSVGLKKRIEIIDYALANGIKVLNPNVKARIKKIGYSSLRELREVHGKEIKKSEETDKQGQEKEENKNREEENKKDKSKGKKDKEEIKSKVESKEKKEGKEERKEEKKSAKGGKKKSK